MDNEKLKELLNNSEGFTKHNNIEYVNLDKDNIRLEVKLTQNSMNPYNMAHGGLTFTLADTAMGLLIRSHTSKNAITINSQIDFLKPGVGEKLIATAKIVKDGKKILVVKSEVKNNEDKLIAIATGTYFITE